LADHNEIVFQFDFVFVGQVGKVRRQETEGRRQEEEGRRQNKNVLMAFGLEIYVECGRWSISSAFSVLPRSFPLVNHVSDQG
jgi:hypothetical protein